MIVAAIMPKAEMVHWWFATGALVLGLLLLAEVVVGPAVWARRPWRRYLWPGTCFLMGVLMWPVMALYTSSMIHMLAHGTWAQALMLAGAAELGVAKGKLRSQYWKLCTALALAASGVGFLVHEQNSWFYVRSAFLHHVLGWSLLAAAIFPLVQAFRPRSVTAATGFALTFVASAVLLYCDRDVASIFGHFAQSGGIPHR